MSKKVKYSINGLLDKRNQLSAAMGCKGIKFAYAVSKNIQKVEHEIHEFRDRNGLNKSNTDYDKYVIAKTKLEEKHAKITDGKVVRSETDGKIVIKDQKAFDGELKALDAKSVTAIKFIEERKRIIDVEAANENVEVEWYKIMKEEDMSQDITAELMLSLEFMINY